MRKTLIFLLLILIPLVFAKTETTKVLHFNESAAVYGKTLTTLHASINDKVKVSVDGVEGIVSGINRTVSINEMWVNMLNFTYVESESFDVIFELTVDLECGDNACNSSETKQSCCTDCGCENNLKCINNICLEEKCVIYADCDDNDSCTIDKCSGSPKSCSNTVIVQCVSSDMCCPESCGAEKDNDCKEGLLEEIKEEAKEETPSAELKAEVPQQVSEPKKSFVTKKEEGILIMAGVAMLVIVLGFIIFRKK